MTAESTGAGSGLTRVLADPEFRRIAALWAVGAAGGKEAARVAQQAASVQAHGFALGLSDDEVREVVRAWSEHYQSTPYPLSWDRVREAVTRRAMNEEWRP